MGFLTSVPDIKAAPGRGDPAVAADRNQARAAAARRAGSGLSGTVLTRDDDAGDPIPGVQRRSRLGAGPRHG